MSFLEIIAVAFAGFSGGVANAVAGGGTFFTFAAFVAFGMPTLEANATSAVALVPGSIATGAAYRHETSAHWREILPLVLIGMIGGVAGGLLLIAIGDDGFRPLVPWLTGGATLLFAFSVRIRQYVQKTAGHRSIGRIPGLALVGLSTAYGGFFGAGLGIVLLAALAVVGSGEFHKANATKNAVAVVSQSMAVALFIGGGLVRWPQAIVSTCAAIAGGYLGVVIARRVREPIVRGAVVAVGAALTLVFFFR